MKDGIGGHAQSLLINGGDFRYSMISSIRQCNSVAKQTVQLCSSTLDTGKDLVACGESIQSSLLGAATDLSPESFAVIADLIDGDKAREARDLAIAMKDRSAECISLSARMIDSLEECVDALPDFIESYVEKRAGESMTKDDSDGLTPEERELATRGIDEDAEELTRCIDAIESSNLLTAIEAGTRSFDAIKEKSSLCHGIFRMIKRFATDVSSITEAFEDHDASAIISKIKDGSILNAIGLSKYMMQFAEGCKSLMDKVVDLFQGAAGKLSTLWRALAHAKDVMVDSLTEVLNARSLCDEAGEKAEQLKEMVLSHDTDDAMTLIKSLSGDDGTRSMNDAESAARGVDVSMEDAALKMKNAAKMVGDKYLSLPSVITDGITDDTDDEIAGAFGGKIRDVDGDVQELETGMRDIEEANIMDVAKLVRREVLNMPDKLDACKDMIKSCTDFADVSKSFIDSFLGKWSLEDAVSKIKEMCRLVSISKLMERLAAQIQKLIKAITTFIRSISNKIQRVADQLKSVRVDSMVDVAEDVVDAAEDFVSDAAEDMVDAAEDAVDAASDYVSGGFHKLFG
jgi:hypothetical protein